MANDGPDGQIERIRALESALILMHKEIASTCDADKVPPDLQAAVNRVRKLSE